MHNIPEFNSRRVRKRYSHVVAGCILPSHPTVARHERQLESYYLRRQHSGPHNEFFNILRIYPGCYADTTWNANGHGSRLQK